MGGYVGQRPGSNVAPGRGSSAICLSRFAFRIRVRTAECQSPQSCLPVRSGTSLVEGKEEVTKESWCIGSGAALAAGLRGKGACGGRIGLAGKGMG